MSDQSRKSRNGHDHARDHAPRNSSTYIHVRHSHGEAPPWLLKLIVLLTLSTFALGLFFWNLSGSVAVFGDALHSLFHTAIASIALWGNVPGRRHKQACAGLYMGIIIILTAIYIAVSGIMSIVSPTQILSSYMIIVASVALVSEITQASLKLSVHYKGVPVRNLFLIKILLRDDFIDMLASIGVIIGGVIIMTTQFYRADGIAAIPIALIAIFLGVKTIHEAQKELKTPEHKNHE